MKLYNYFRSSASVRVRIALELKGLNYEYIPVHLAKSEQLSPEFRAMNPDALVPVLVDGDVQLVQSLAICEYLDEIHPEPPLLPGNAAARARIRGLAQAISSDIHPLNNLRVLRYLVKQAGVSDDAKNAWYRHWVETGLTALETRLAASADTGRFCHGDTPTLADVCLVPQVFNGQRFQCDFSAMPTVMRIHETCMALEAFQKAAPAAAPDAE